MKSAFIIGIFLGIASQAFGQSAAIKNIIYFENESFQLVEQIEEQQCDSNKQNAILVLKHKSSNRIDTIERYLDCLAKAKIDTAFIRTTINAKELIIRVSQFQSTNLGEHGMYTFVLQKYMVWDLQQRSITASVLCNYNYKDDYMNFIQTDDNEEDDFRVEESTSTFQLENKVEFKQHTIEIQTVKYTCTTTNDFEECSRAKYEIADLEFLPGIYKKAENGKYEK